MRWELVVMMAVVGAINLIGRVMAKRAKDRMRADESSRADGAGAESRAPVPAGAVRPPPVPPVRRARPPLISPVAKVSVQAPAARSAAAAPTPVASVRAPLGTPAAMARAVRTPVRGRTKVWSAGRARDGFIASLVFGPPASLQEL